MKALGARLLTVFLLVGVGGSILTAVLAEDSTPIDNREPHFFSKHPWGVNFSMDGTVTNVVEVGGQIQFQVNGRFVFSQFPPENPQPVQVEVHPRGWFSAAVTPDSFVAVGSGGRWASVQNDKRRLCEILRTAATRGTVVQLALSQPKIDFGTNDSSFTVIDAKVLKISDPDLR